MLMLAAIPIWFSTSFNFPTRHHIHRFYISSTFPLLLSYRPELHLNILFLRYLFVKSLPPLAFLSHGCGFLPFPFHRPSSPSQLLLYPIESTPFYQVCSVSTPRVSAYHARHLCPLDSTCIILPFFLQFVLRLCTFACDFYPFVLNVIFQPYQCYFFPPFDTFHQTSSYHLLPCYGMPLSYGLFDMDFTDTSNLHMCGPRHH
jgi:hypothetical protein